MNLEIKNLSTKISEKEILKNLNLTIKEGEIHAIMGPNGAGKSTITKVLMGYPDYQIRGDILLNNQSIINKDITERANLGIFLVYQNPISIEGVTNSELIKTSLDNKTKPNLYEFIKELNQNVVKLEMSKEMLNRSFNVGFSGGERKKNEILQLLMLKPKFIILDELDSGLDVDSLKIVADNLNNYLKENPKTAVLIITHYTRILNYLHPTYVHILKDGQIKATGDFKLAKLIEKNGYNQTFDIDMSDLNE